VRLPTYRRYKQSGVEWLGEVPEHWEVKRLKFIFPVLRSGVSVNSENSPTADDSPGILKTSCVYGNRFRPEENKCVLETEFDRLACPVTRDSLVISRMNTPELVGSCGYVQTDHTNLFLPDRLWIARFSKHESLNGKFAWYLVTSHLLASLTAALATGTSDSMKNLTHEAFLDIPVGVPPRTEQLTIASRLDAETARIDLLLAKKRELIERLKEKRTALISRAVTRGLPPDAARAAGFSENPPLKPSGVDWLGDIPVHWEVKPVKFIARIGNGSTPNRDNPNYWEDGDYPWLNSSVVNQEAITEAQEFVTLLALRECHLPQIAQPAVLIGITGQGRTRGMASTLLFEATINQHVAYLKPYPLQADVGFLRRVFDMGYLFLRSESDGGGSTKGAITCEQIANLRIPVPPLPEQIAIGTYLGAETVKLDALTAKVEAAIERLEEYRTALITAAVTGKIDVRTTTM
jgi:type I restriction enzyme S subunit